MMCWRKSKYIFGISPKNTPGNGHQNLCLKFAVDRCNVKYRCVGNYLQRKKWFSIFL